MERTTRSKAAGRTAVALLLAILAAPVLAQSWPQRPVRMVVPFAPGGATDIIARVVSQRLGDGLGQQVVIDNRPGAGTTLGTAQVARATPDGYTLLFAPTPFVIAPALYAAPGFDPLRDFAPVALLAISPFVLVVNAGTMPGSVGALVASARAQPGRITFASAGNGTVPHLAGELFRMHTGAPLTHVPYKGGGPALLDLISGQVHMMFATPIEVAPHLPGGRLRLLAATGQSRLASYPDLPTLRESGWPDLEVQSFFGVVAPAGTPAPVIERLGAALAAVTSDAEVRQKLSAQSADPRPLHAAAFGEFLARERERWKDVVARSGARAD